MLVRRDLVLRLVAGVVRASRRVTGHPRDAAVARIEAALARMREIPLNARSTAALVAIALVVWACDFLCLLCGFAAVHAAVPWEGVLLAYGAAQVVGSLPIVPGASASSRAASRSSWPSTASRGSRRFRALAYRLVSFWLSITVGWISVGGIAAATRRKGRGILHSRARSATVPVTLPVRLHGPVRRLTSRFYPGCAFRVRGRRSGCEVGYDGLGWRAGRTQDVEDSAPVGRRRGRRGPGSFAGARLQLAGLGGARRAQAPGPAGAGRQGPGAPGRCTGCTCATRRPSMLVRPG